MLKGESPMPSAPASTFPVDLAATKAELQATFEDAVIDDEDLNGYLMYPKVFTDYMARHEDYGPVRVLPTLTYFYGMEPGKEISAEIDPGKIMEIRLIAVGETRTTARSASSSS
ncbi:hypothetical protein [Salipiger sp.]|uniref:hypothetical protein n=1 Tax=Salipiger sp. TaxID=2078585 RepID=UPI003A981368